MQPEGAFNQEMQEARAKNLMPTPSRRRRGTVDAGPDVDPEFRPAPLTRPRSNPKKNAAPPSLRASMPTYIPSAIDRLMHKPHPPRFKKGAEACYKYADGRTVAAKIVEVHFDDLLEPYYTVSLDGGVEKQTDEAHLMPLSGRVPSHHSSSAEGDAPVSGVDEGVHVLTLDEAKPKQKKKKGGMCGGCGEVRTHKPGLWKQMMPLTVDGQAYKGVCLRCNTLDGAKLQLGEPIRDGPGALPRMSIVRQQRPPPPLIGGTSTPPSNQSSAVLRRIRPSNGQEFARSLVRRRRSTTTSVERDPRDALALSPNTVLRPLEPQARPDIAPNRGRSAARRAERGRLALSMPQSSAVPVVYGINETRLGVAPQHADSTGMPADPRSKYAAQRFHGVQRTLSTEPVSPSTPGSSNDDLKRSAESLEPQKKTVRDFRCGDANGDFGFYTGTMVTLYTETEDEEHIPHGRGEMVYDIGVIAKGVWSRGELKVKVSPASERYEPFLLPDYSVGDAGDAVDMANSTTFAISKLHVGDCAFIKRSGGTWSYSVVKDRTDSDPVSITFVVNTKGSTKTIPIPKWAGNVRLPTKPDILPDYAVGDHGLERDMIVASQIETVQSVVKMRIDDAAFVRRSDGSWTYAIVIDRTKGENPEITFEINQRGCTKVIPILQCGRSIRRIKQRHRGPSDEEAKVICQMISNAEKASKRKDGRRVANVGSGNKSPTPDHDQQAPQVDDDRHFNASSLSIRQCFHESNVSLRVQPDYEDMQRPVLESDTKLDPMHEEDNAGRSGHNQETQVLAIYDNSHHNVDDEHVLTDEGSAGCYSTLTEGTDDGIPISDKVLMSVLIARRRRRARMEDAADCEAESLAESLEQRFRKTRRAEAATMADEGDQTDEGGYSSLTDDESKQSLNKARAKDRLLLTLMARAIQEDAEDGGASVDYSLDESLASLKESFLEWRQKRKESRVNAKNKKSKKDKKKKKRKDDDRKKSSGRKRS